MFRYICLLAASASLLVISLEAAYTGPTTVAGVTLIKSFESFRANFYFDAVGVKTIGYGHACLVASQCAGIIPPLSEAQAITLLRQDMSSSERCVRNRVSYGNLNSAQFSALVSFTFNLGCGNLGSSTLLSLLNRGDTLGASNEFKRFNKAGGRVLPGLTRRREAERVLFCSEGGC